MGGEDTSEDRRPGSPGARQAVVAAAIAVCVALPVGVSWARRAGQEEAAQAQRQAAIQEEPERARQSAYALACTLPRAAREFVAGYIEPVSTPRSEWAQGCMPYLYQTDPAFADAAYSNGLMRLQGCGPFALTMVYVDLTGDTSMGPLEMADFATQMGFSTDREGSSWDLAGSGARALGLSSEAIDGSADSMWSALAAGSDVICVMGPGTFTRVGHFIAIDGLDADGRAIVHDSNSYIRSHTTWDLELISSELRCAWAISVETAG